MDDIELEKSNTAEIAVSFIKKNMNIGLGTGSTVYYTIKKIGELINNGLRIKAVSTSCKTTALAKKYNIPILDINDVDYIDLTIDGADEVNHDLNLIKGGGGALLREKIVASISKQLIIVIDSSKYVAKLGNFPLPVEVLKMNHRHVFKKFKELGYNPSYRMVNRNFFATDNDNYIIDLKLNEIDNPEDLEKRINYIPGVVDNGLFINMTDVVISNKTIYRK